MINWTTQRISGRQILTADLEISSEITKLVNGYPPLTCARGNPKRAQKYPKGKSPGRHWGVVWKSADPLDMGNGVLGGSLSSILWTYGPRGEVHLRLRIRLNIACQKATGLFLATRPAEDLIWALNIKFVSKISKFSFWKIKNSHKKLNSNVMKLHLNQHTKTPELNSSFFVCCEILKII